MLDYTLREIKGGVPMGKNVTIVQIAKECGVSVATVSRVLNGTAPVSEEKRSERVAELQNCRSEQARLKTFVNNNI